MKVLLTIPDLCADAGGPPVVVVRMAGALCDLDVAVNLLYATPPDRTSLAIPVGVTAHAVKWTGNAWNRYRAFRGAASRLIREDGIDLVHDHGLWLPENIGAADAALATRRPLVLQPCGMLQAWAFAQQAAKKQLAWWLYQRRRLRRAAAVIVTADAERAESAARIGAAAPPMPLIPHGVDAPLPTPGLERQRQALYLGRLHPKKQVDVLLDAWAQIRPTGWRLAIAGSGDPDYEQALRAQAARLGIAEQVRFLGAVHGDAKSALLAGSQLFLQPSLHENFGLAVAEAMMHGLPALTTQEMPWQQLATQRCGWSVPADAASVRAAMAEGLALPAETLADMGARARRLGEQYSWPAAAATTQQLYASLIG